jgi:hypothetical protein
MGLGARRSGSPNRKAIVNVRQSSPHQVVNKQESLRLQYALCQDRGEIAEDLPAERRW